MRRRAFGTLLGGSALWPLATRAQPKAIPRLGGIIPPSRRKSFEQGLRDLGYIEGRTIALEYRWFEHADQLPGIAAELVRLEVAVIVTQGSQAARAAQQATKTIPIVMAAASDPVGIGLVESLARPGGNVTGQSMQNTELSGKRLELLKEVVPSLRRVSALLPDDPPARLALTEAATAARSLGIDLHVAEVHKTADIDSAFRSALANQSQALFILTAPLMMSNIGRLAEQALGGRLPTIYPFRIFPEAGGLMSYGISLDALSRRAPIYVDKILKGAKPADLPVEQASAFEMVINMKTAKTIGLTIPPSVLARADEVIE